MPSSFHLVTLLSRAPAFVAGALLAVAELGAQGRSSLPRLRAAELGLPHPGATTP